SAPRKQVVPVGLLDIPLGWPSGEHGQPAVTIRAFVNDQAILDEDVRASAYQDLMRARALPDSQRIQRTKEILDAALIQLVEREVVLQDALQRLKGPDKKGDRYVKRLQEAAAKAFEKQVLKPMKAASGIKNEDDFKRLFANEGLALESIRRQFERNFMVTEYLRSRVFPIIESRVNHNMILEYYNKHPEDFQVVDSVQWLDIFVAIQKHGSLRNARVFAEKLVDEARRGADFVELCTKNDDGDSSLRGGEGVGRKRGEIKPPEAEAILFGLKSNEVGPLIELPGGYHLVKVVKREYAGQLPFNEKVQKDIKNKLQNDIARLEIKRIIADLKRKAVIEYAIRQKGVGSL
ncbi:MAG: peptidylprolyl isomerase, partial [Candidatus Acidiferrum sp.]